MARQAAFEMLYASQSHLSSTTVLPQKWPKVSQGYVWHAFKQEIRKFDILFGFLS